MVDQQELKREQDYFDAAAENLERALAGLDRAGIVAGDKKAGHALKVRAEKARELVSPNDPVAFGRFDTDDEALYLGKRSILNPQRDVLVINWQSTAAEPFYQATPTEPGNVVRKRTYVAPRNRIEGWQDLVLAQIAANLAALTNAPDWAQPDDAVLTSLNQSRDDTMRDIVATIQAAQDGIVRSPLDRLMIVQGGPGTGKTAVALHRVSWILFNHANIAPADILVVGPNPTFVRYIRKVLPDLGDTDVAHSDLTELGPVVTTGAREPAEVAHLKGDARMAGLLSRAVFARVRMPSGLRPETFGLTDEDVTRAIEVGRLAMISAGYASGRAEVRAQLQGALAQAQQMRARTRDEARRQSTAAGIRSIEPLVERIWPNLSAPQFLRELLGSRERLLDAAADDFSAAEVSSLYRQATEKVSAEPWTVADVALLDEAQELLSGAPPKFRHIVVDEAQDLSPMQMRSLRRRSIDGSMTIVGDIAQSTGAWARNAWDDVGEALAQKHPVDIRTLEIGYRVPAQVMAIAERLLPVIAPGIRAPRVIRKAAQDPLWISRNHEDLALAAVKAAREYASLGLFVGIVVPENLREGIVDVLTRAGVNWSDGRSGALGSTGINVVDPQTSKGLEFEAVVVVSPAEITRLEQGSRLLYIALTRTTKFLSIVHDGLRGTGLEEGEVGESALSVAHEEATAESTSAGVRSADADNINPAVDEQPPSAARVTGGPTTSAAPTPNTPGPHDRPAHREAGEESRQRRPTTPLEARVVAASVEELVDQIRRAVRPELWAAVLDAVRRDLDITSEEFLDFLE